MPLSLRRSYLAGTVSALVLSATFAWAQETSTDPALQDETLVQGAAPGAVVVDPDRVGNAHEALAGMSVGDIQGMEVFDSAGDKIGNVEMVAENERGGVFVIVVAEGSSNWLAEGQHAIPLISFDYNQEANGLVLRDDMAPMSTAGMSTTGDPAGWGPEGTRVFSVLDSGATVEQVDLEAYQTAEMDTGEDVDLTDTSDERIIGDSRQVLQQENITDLEGRDIISADGEDIASVEAVAYDDQGRVYLIASFGGFLGIGDEYRAVPLEAFNYSLDEEAFVFTEGGEETLQSLQEWDYDQAGYTVVESDLDWSAFDQSEFAQTGRSDPDQPAMAEGEATDSDGESAMIVGDARDVLEEQGISQLEGMDILNPDLEDIGTVEDVAQDDQGRLHLIVSLDDGVLGIGDSERAVSIDAFDYSPEEEALVLLDVSEASLEAMPEWDSDNPQFALIESDLDWATVAHSGTGMSTDEPMVGEAIDTTEQATEQAMTEGEQALDQAGEATEQAATETEQATEQAIAEAEEALDEAGEATEQAATETEQATEQALAEGEQALDQAGEATEQAATETEQATEQALAEGEQALDQAGEATEQAATETEQATEQALDQAGEATEQAATETVDETAAQVEPAAGAEQGAPQTDQPVTDDAAAANVGNARQLLQEHAVVDIDGLDILNAEGDDIGTVEDVAQDAEGRLHLVVSLDDGILGLGDSERVVPLDVFDYLPEEEALYLRDISEPALEAMREWDEDDGMYTVIDEDVDWTMYN